ncbi:perlucin-like protein [Mizuhopecten yessoensis]|uniref:Perlucin-like protein n=1 Tax=Mizuhopecten yessoensis TaxID=6573 RepID=A0A210R405_MIZYE|nr:perlucin-like protein [Mizuhopecten yessoensis]OWF55685.1 Perlucin-like protein [Mizuhopecten yessoensis]
MYCLILLILTVGQALARCPNGWTAHGDSCYHVSRDEASWVEATRMCELHSAYLTKVQTSYEETFLSSIVRSLHHGHTFWLGGSDWTTEGEWVWEPEGTPFLYKDWANKQPDNHANQDHCLALEGSVHFQWTDENCQDTNRYICERSAYSDIVTTIAPIIETAGV